MVVRLFTTEDSYQQQAVIDGEAALLDILDTAGQVEFTAMRDQYMRCGEGFIICYSVTDRHSFQEASEYRKLIARVRLTEEIPLVLIANKLDLQSQRKVSIHSIFNNYIRMNFHRKNSNLQIKCICNCNTNRSVPMKASSWQRNLVVPFMKLQPHCDTTSMMLFTHSSVRFDERKTDG